MAADTGHRVLVHRDTSLGTLIMAADTGHRVLVHRDTSLGKLIMVGQLLKRRS